MNTLSVKSVDSVLLGDTPSTDTEISIEELWQEEVFPEGATIYRLYQQALSLIRLWRFESIEEVSESFFVKYALIILYRTFDEDVITHITQERFNAIFPTLYNVTLQTFFADEVDEESLENFCELTLLTAMAVHLSPREPEKGVEQLVDVYNIPEERKEWLREEMSSSKVKFVNMNFH